MPIDVPVECLLPDLRMPNTIYGFVSIMHGKYNRRGGGNRIDSMANPPRPQRRCATAARWSRAWDAGRIDRRAKLRKLEAAAAAVAPLAAIDMPYDTIKQDLKDMITLLESDGCKGWATFFREAIDLLDHGMSAECGRHIMSGSGGMGSLNDLILGQGQDQHGQFQWKDGYKEMNDRYRELLNRLYGFSHGIQKAANKA